MDERLKSINSRIHKVYLGRKDEFDHSKSLERRKMLNKEAYILLKNNMRKEEISLRKKYTSMIKKQLNDLHHSPKDENRVIEEKMAQMKERALQRTVQLSLEIKKNTDWQMPKLVDNVLSRKQRARDEKLKEQEQRRIAKVLRHQLAHQNVLSGIGKWLTHQVVHIAKNVQNKKKDETESLSETSTEDMRERTPVVVPLFNICEYASHRKTNSK